MFRSILAKAAGLRALAPILAKAASLEVLGKSPAGFYLRLNKRIWQRLPSRVRNLYPVRWYGAWLHTWFASAPIAGSISARSFSGIVRRSN